MGVFFDMRRKLPTQLAIGRSHAGGFFVDLPPGRKPPTGTAKLTLD